MAFRVVDAGHAHRRALELGAKPAQTTVGPNELAIPAIEGIGGLQIYLVDRYGAKGSIYDVDFNWLGARDPKPDGAGLFYIDHLTHNVHRGRLDEWAAFYEKLLNFRQIRFFDIAGKVSGLHSRAMTSPDGKIRIPINEDAGAKGQIQEYLEQYQGEGIQHVALGARDLYASIETLAGRGVEFMPAPNDLIFAHRPTPAEARRAHRPPAPRRHPDRRRRRRRRRPHQGAAPAFRQDRHRPDLLRVHPAQGRRRFGEGNFKALFESIEEDQIRRGVLVLTPPSRRGDRFAGAPLRAGRCHLTTSLKGRSAPLARRVGIPLHDRIHLCH